MKKLFFPAIIVTSLTFFACQSKPAADNSADESANVESAEQISEQPVEEAPLAEEPTDSIPATDSLATDSLAVEPLAEQPAPEQPAEEPVDEQETVFLIVDKMPVPPFSKEELVNELAKWLDDVDPEANDCRVMVRVVVEKDGKVTHPEVLRSSGYEKVDAYALKRVLEKMPKFKEPAMKGGKPCRAYYTVPVYFKKKS